MAERYNLAVQYEKLPDFFFLHFQTSTQQSTFMVSVLYQVASFFYRSSFSLAFEFHIPSQPVKHMSFVKSCDTVSELTSTDVVQSH